MFFWGNWPDHARERNPVSNSRHRKNYPSAEKDNVDDVHKAPERGLRTGLSRLKSNVILHKSLFLKVYIYKRNEMYSACGPFFPKRITRGTIR